MLKDLVLGLLARKLKEPTTYMGIIVAIGTALHVTFTDAQATDFTTILAAIVSLALIYITEHKAPTAEQANNVIDLVAKGAKDTIASKAIPVAKVAIALFLLLPLLAGCGTLKNNGAWITAQSKAGTAFCGKDYDATDPTSRSLCEGMILIAASELAADRVTHGQTDDAPYVSGFIASNQIDVQRLSGGGAQPFMNADEFNFQRKMGSAALHVVHREVSFIQLATAGITTGVAAASGGSTIVAAAASGGGWLLPDFIGQPATLAADYAGKLIAFQADAAAMMTAVKTKAMTVDDAWKAITARLETDKAAVDALTRAQ